MNYFVEICKSEGLPIPELEYRFCKDRKWRFDYAWPQYRVALEVEGGVFLTTRPDKSGRQRSAGHANPNRFVKDIEKYNAAYALEWTVIRCLPVMSFKSVQKLMKSTGVKAVYHLHARETTTLLKRVMQIKSQMTATDLSYSYK